MKIIIGIISVLVFTLMNQAIAEIKEETKEEKGVRITTKREIKSTPAGTGTVYSETILDIKEDNAGKNISDEYSKRDELEGAVICASIDLLLLPSAVPSAILGIACSVWNTSLRPDLRKGDKIIRYVFAGGAGGAGGTTISRELAFGKRDGKIKILWLSYHPSDKKEAEVWVKKQLNKHQ